MVVGDDVAVVGLDHHAGAGGARIGQADLDGDHRGGDPAGDVGDRAGLAADARRDRGQLGARGEQRLLVGGAAQEPGGGATDDADQQQGQQGQDAQPHRDVPQPELLRPCASTTTGPSSVSGLRRVLGGCTEAGRRVRVAPRVGCGRRASTTGRWRCGGGRAGRRAGPAARAGRAPAGRRRAAAPRRAAAGRGRGGGSGPAVGEAAGDRRRAGRRRPAGRRWATAPSPAAARAGRAPSSNGPVWSERFVPHGLAGV